VLAMQNYVRTLLNSRLSSTRDSYEIQYYVLLYFFMHKGRATLNFFVTMINTQILQNPYVT
jgi:hypothetical protein